MFSYYEKGFKGKKMDKVISIDSLVEYIKDHPEKDVIGELRRTEYKSQKYNDIKETLACVTPSGIFMNSRSPEDILQLSGYLFFDIDLPSGSVEELKQEIIDNYKEYISLLGVSVGGKGLFFYVKVNNVNKDNYTSIYEYFRTEVFSDLDIDNNAKGINRAHIIPYDTDVYFNPNSNVDISIEVNKNNKKKETLNIKNNKTGCYILNVSFHPIDEVWKSIKTQTEVEVGDSLFTIEPVDYLKLFIPKEIKDGRKHSTFRALTMAIMYLNPELDLLTVQSFINYVNYNHTTKPMHLREMMRTVENCYNTIKETGEIGIELKSKILHFNKESTLSSREKKQLASKINGRIRCLRSVASMEKAITNLKDKGNKVTRKSVSVESGLSLKTVSRNWDMSLEEIANEIVGYNRPM